MERLTFEGNFCDIAQCRDLPCKHDGSCSQKQVWDRLREYEDAGLSPEGCAEAMKAEKVLSICGVSLKKVIELLEADKDDRVVVLPCKVGDTVYTLEYVADLDGTCCEIKPRKITGIGGNALNKVWLVSANSAYEVRISPSEFGKTVFLTREEAEKALQEMEGKKDG